MIAQSVYNMKRCCHQFYRCLVDEWPKILSEIQLGYYIGHRHVGILSFADDITQINPSFNATQKMLQLAKVTLKVTLCMFMPRLVEVIYLTLFYLQNKTWLKM